MENPAWAARAIQLNPQLQTTLGWSVPDGWPADVASLEFANAVAAFQQDHGVSPVDGILGPVTLEKLTAGAVTINVVIDISNDESPVDFAAAARDGIVGVIHKATQGVGYVDPRYAERTPLAKAAGLLWGAYHFGTGRCSGAEQADFFLATAASSAGVLVLDFEENPAGASMTVQQARDFVSRVHAQTGRWPGLYAGHYLREQIGDAPDPVLTSCWLWFAEYAPTPARLPPQWASWTLWQYTDGHAGPPPHSVAGIGPCDRDKFAGDLAALRALWGVAAC